MTPLLWDCPLPPSPRCWVESWEELALEIPRVFLLLYLAKKKKIYTIKQEKKRKRNG
jgi:hypothetical protein